MRRIAAVTTIGLAALALGASSASAAGTTRHAAPAAQGAGDCSSPADACDLVQAVNGAGTGDAVVMAPGDYSVAADLVNAAADLVLRGPAPGTTGEARITSTGKVFLSPTSILRDLRFTTDNSLAGASEVITAGTIERSVIRLTDTFVGGSACNAYVAVTDSACISQASAALKVVAANRQLTVTVRNATLVGGRYGLLANAVSTSAPAQLTVEVSNSIITNTAFGTLAPNQRSDIAFAENVLGSDPADVTVNVAHSTWETSASADGSAGGGDELSAGAGNRVGPAPSFVNPAAGDVRVVPGSATIDAGDEAGVPGGAADPRGLPRTIGAAPDMGAYESAAPAAGTLPAITGEVRQGATLTLADGTWEPAGLVSLTRRWQRCAADGGGCADIAGATGATYALGADDVGRRVRAVVTATTVDGGASAESPATAVVAGPPATPAPPTGGPSPDRTPPKVASGRITPARFPARRPGRATFRLSEAATLSFRVERRAGKRWRALGRPSSRKAPAGRATIRLPRNLPVGRYRLVITARDAAGNRSTAVRLTFRVRF
jgi:hypothetical protein